MKTIFIVTSGEYSEYGIEAVFSTEKFAKDYIKANSLEDANIEPWGIDCADPYGGHFEGLSRFIIMMKRNGDVEKIFLPQDDEATYWPQDHGDFEIDEEKIIICIIAKDESYAIKIAGEKRRQLIAENKWPEGR